MIYCLNEYERGIFMEQNELKNGIGIASFIIGIVGFLTGFIAIGMLFDIVAIILAIVALVSKKQKNGFAIAGLAIAALGFIIMVFLVGVFDNNKKESIEIQSTTIEKEATSNVKEISTQEELSEKDLTVEDYSCENTIGDTMYFLVVKNNSNKTLSINSNCTAYNSENTIIGADSSSIDALGCGCESVITNYFDSVSGIDHFEYTLSMKEDEYNNSVLADINMNLSPQEDKVIVTCTNNGSVPAEFVEATALFFKDGRLVDYGCTYITDDDSEIKPGSTLSEQIDIYGTTFDDVKVYLTGRKSK